MFETSLSTFFISAWANLSFSFFSLATSSSLTGSNLGSVKFELLPVITLLGVFFAAILLVGVFVIGVLFFNPLSICFSLSVSLGLVFSGFFPRIV